jgi:hypothetical protein
MPINENDKIFLVIRLPAAGCGMVGGSISLNPLLSRIYQTISYESSFFVW